MYFTVLTAGSRPPTETRNQAFLIADNWSDWNKYTTRYALVIVDSAGVQHPIGDVKIGEFGMESGRQRPRIPSEFDTLGSEFFSLGQDDTYYEELNKRRKTTRDKVLAALRDIAADPKIFDKAKNEAVTTESLLRSVAGVTVQGQFRRLAKGGERLTPYKFKYTGPRPVGDHGDDAKPVQVDFEVDPDSNPPSNIHVLIGPNGVGKTYVLEMMARALMEGESTSTEYGVFETMGKAGSANFAGVVSVTFSAFDPFEPLPDRRGETGGIRYSYVGLKSTSKNVAVKGTPKNLKLLTGEFTKSLEKCAMGPKAERWRDAVKTLEADPLFKDNNASSLIDGFGEEEEGAGTDWKMATDKLADEATELFMSLSTGHKIVLLAITRLVETVEERTLVLFDEPESHLHPPLLSAFIRALSNLLINRNGVAILATHSPVVLQEVPRTCAWKLRRYGDVVQAERPETETFGENVSVLTREIFGLDLTNSGFHNVLREAIDKEKNYDAVMKFFSDQLGGEARAVARALLAARAEAEDK